MNGERCRSWGRGLHRSDAGRDDHRHEQARHVIELLFEQFQRRGTIQGVLCYLLEHDLKLPVRIMSGPDKGELRWSRPSRSTLQQVFINPAYAGVTEQAA
ncbi:hypothetical protein [Sorangium atrum]|uniref:Recombinase domain-containing protein n=1 Tax=Sorangium atrum TaxID=2995308 RepID=A0ABT5CEP8_9BACT|nr:hypothetical protein [Sorangium aterium]MDC0684928.1 hypothetical protein [Sorangium aterium]